MSIEGFPAVDFLPQIEQLPQLVTVRPEVSEIQSADLILKFKVTFFPIMKTTEDENLIS